MHLGPHIEQPGGGTAAGGVNIAASDTTYTSGTVVFTGGANITVSTNGQTVSIIGGAGGAGFTGGVSNIGNTLGDTGTVSNRVVFAGGNRVTLSQSTAAAGATITISGPNAQTAISGLANSETTYTSGTVSLSAMGNLTIRSTTGNQYQFSVAAQTTQVETQTFLGGLANSETTYTSGSVTLSALANITIRSTTGQHFQFSVPSGATATGNINAISNSDTTYTSGTIGLSALTNITIRSTTGNQFQFSVPGTTGTGNLNAISNSDTTYTSGTIGLSALANITIRSTTGNQFQFSVPGTTGTGNLNAISNSNTTYTSGTIGLSELGAITIRSTTGNQFQFSVNSQTDQSAIRALGVSNTGNTAGNTGVSTGINWVIAGSGGITASQSTAGGGPNTIWMSVAAPVAQTNQSAIRGFGASNTGNTAGNTGMVTGVDWVLAGSTNITVSQSTAVGGPNTLWLSAPNAGAGGFSGAGVSGGNTSGHSGTVGSQVVFAGGNNITLSGSTNGGSMTITVSAPNLGAGAMSAGVSTGGNTAGATGITGTQMVLVGTGPISLSQTTGANGGTVSINAPATSSLSATGAVSISTNGSTISIGAPYESGAVYENFPLLQGSVFTHLSAVSKTPFYWYENMPQGVKPANIAFRVSVVTANAPLSLSAHFGIYTFANSTSIALLGSGSDAFVVSSASSVSLSAQRYLIMTSPGTVAGISSLTPGAYVFGMMFSATATNAMNASIYAASVGAARPLGQIGPGTNQLTTASSGGVVGFLGRGSTTVNALPANVVASEVGNLGSDAAAPIKPWIFIRS